MESSLRSPMLVKRVMTVSGRTKVQHDQGEGGQQDQPGCSRSRKMTPANSRPSQAPREKVSIMHTTMLPQQHRYKIRSSHSLVASRQAPPRGMISRRYCPSILGFSRVEGTRK